MKPEEIKRLRELAAKATPRPWGVNKYGWVRYPICDGSIQEWEPHDEYYSGCNNSPSDDATYITAAANALPELLAEIERLEEVIGSLTSVCGVYEDEVEEALNIIQRLNEVEKKHNLSRVAELEAELAALKERNRWIPVSERLPEFASTEVEVAYRAHDQKRYRHGYACYFKDMGWCREGYDWMADYGYVVEYWRPKREDLPEPPEVEG